MIEEREDQMLGEMRERRDNGEADRAAKLAAPQSRSDRSLLMATRLSGSLNGNLASLGMLLLLLGNLESKQTIVEARLERRVVSQVGRSRQSE